MPTYGFGKDKVVEMGGGSGFLRGIGVLVLGFVLLIFLFASVAKVPTGHVGVLTLFGRVTGESLPEGIHLVNPLKANNVLSVRTQELKESASVPSSEGLVISLDTSLLFRLRSDKAADLYQNVGPGYVSIIIEPTLRTAIREATSS